MSLLKRVNLRYYVFHYYFILVSKCIFINNILWKKKNIYSNEFFFSVNNFFLLLRSIQIRFINYDDLSYFNLFFFFFYYHFYYHCVHREKIYYNLGDFEDSLEAVFREWISEIEIKRSNLIWCPLPQTFELLFTSTKFRVCRKERNY